MAELLSSAPLVAPIPRAGRKWAAACPEGMFCIPSQAGQPCSAHLQKEQRAVLLEVPSQ